MKYFSDKSHGGARKSLATAEKKLSELRELLDSSRKINGKLTKTTVKKAEKLLGE